MKVQTSLACLPGMTHLDAVHQVLRHQPLIEPKFGQLGTEHVQLVPQCRGVVDCNTAALLTETFPDVQFRLHANVRVMPGPRLADLSTFQADIGYFRTAGEVSRRLGAPVYSAHAGYRKNATLHQVFDNAKRCEDLFGCVVAVEGLYPTPGGPDRLVASWSEYNALLNSGVAYALDLSQLL